VATAFPEGFEGVASMSMAQNFFLSSRRSIRFFRLARLASMKCSLTARFSSL
jgi:hypothetical protein